MLRAVAVLLLLAALSVPAAGQDAQQRRAVQSALENAEDLGSRARALLVRARGRLAEGDAAAAESMVAEWLAGDPGRSHHLLWFNLGLSRWSLDDDAGAREAFANATEAAPDYARAWLRRGEAAYGADDLDDAARSFARAWRLLPERPLDLAFSLAAIHLQNDRPDSALARLETVFAQAPDSLRPDWYRTAVAAAQAAGRPAAARRHVERLLELAPSDPDAWDLAYREAAGREDYEAAAAFLSVKGDLVPLSGAELRQLGDLCAALNVPAEAARHYTAALAAGGGAPEDHERLAAAWLAAHEPARAREALRAGLDAGETARLWSLLGDLEFRAGDFDAALTAFARACELGPERGRDWLLRGWSAVELGRKSEARDHLQRALEFADQAAAAERLLIRLDTAP